MKRFLPVLTLALASATLVAAQAPAPDGPSLAETIAWIRSEAPALLGSHGSKADSEYSITNSTDETPHDLAVVDCRLSWVDDHAFSLSTRFSPKPQSEHTTSVVSVALKDLDLGALVSRDATFLSDTPMYAVLVKTRADVGKTISSAKDGAPAEMFGSASIYVKRQDDGQRLANALQRAAVLCGAPKSPF